MKPQVFNSQLLSLVKDDPRAEPSVWVLSVILGILACRTIYKAMKYISPSFPQYTRLSKTEKIEWDNRGFSSAHAVFISGAAAYFLFFSDLFDDNKPYGPVIIRTSMLCQMVLGVSVGYFISDLAMILRFYPALGGNEYVLHHLLSMASLSISIYTGHANLYVYLMLLSEITTPFVNLRWYLSVAGMKDSVMYLVNGIVLFLGWMLARVILFFYFFIHLYLHYDQVQQVSRAALFCVLIVPPCLAVMNLVWFYKVVRGMLKMLSKRA